MKTLLSTLMIISLLSTQIMAQSNLLTGPSTGGGNTQQEQTSQNNSQSSDESWVWPIIIGIGAIGLMALGGSDNSSSSSYDTSDNQTYNVFQGKYTSHEEEELDRRQAIRDYGLEN